MILRAWLAGLLISSLILSVSASECYLSVEDCPKCAFPGLVLKSGKVTDWHGQENSVLTCKYEPPDPKAVSTKFRCYERAALNFRCYDDPGMAAAVYKYHTEGGEDPECTGKYCRLMGRPRHGCIGTLSVGISCGDVYLMKGNYFVGVSTHVCEPEQNPPKEVSERIRKYQEGMREDFKACAESLSPKGFQGNKLTGKITDGFGHPLKHVRVDLNYDGSYEQTFADENGSYEFKLKNPPSGKDARLYVKLMYAKNKDPGTVFFRITNQKESVWIMKVVTIKTTGDLRQDFDLADGLSGNNNHFGHPDPEDIRHFSIMYHHMTEALEFYKDVLGWNVKYKLPVDVITFLDDPEYPSTAYSTTNGDIIIHLEDSHWNDTDRPMNREWHEFGHHAMFSQYGKMPDSEGDTGNYTPDTDPDDPLAAIEATVVSENHGGYLNPSTDDSYVEGFAEFGSLMIAEYYGYPNPSVYASFGNLEATHKAWDKLGKHEELAVAAVLWDMNDIINDDMMYMNRTQIYGLLKPYRKDFTEVYKAFITKYPTQKEFIDPIFIKQGFYIDTTNGDLVRQSREPYDDSNYNDKYDTGDYFLDYPETWRYKENMTVGSASNYQRPGRTNVVRLPGHYVKVSNTIPFYKVKIVFPDNHDYDFETLTENRDGLVYVPVPAGFHNAEVTVTADGVKTGSPLKINSREFDDDLEQSILQGYYVEHDFQVSGTPPSRPEIPEYLIDKSSYTPYWEDMDAKASPVDYEVKTVNEGQMPLESEIKARSSARSRLPMKRPLSRQEKPSKSGNWLWLAAGGTIIGFLILVALFAIPLLILILAAYFLFKKKKTGK
ncbi:VOC family protein [Candidatus Altiarchaeota archaeon]